ncbi:hypothetical protein D3C84_1032630 [compost metagenome]
MALARWVNCCNGVRVSLNGWHQFFSGGKPSVFGAVVGDMGWGSRVGPTGGMDLGVVES